MHGEMATAEALLVFSFGAAQGRRSAVPNRQLAVLTDRYPNLPVLAQTEVAVAVARRGRTVVDIETDLRQQQQLSAGTYVDTGMIASAAATIVRAAGWSRVGVLAHPVHMGRCAALVQATGVTPIVPDLDGERIDFDSRSVQWWTRSPAAWSFRETGVLLHHKLLRRL